MAKANDKAEKEAQAQEAQEGLVRIIRGEVANALNGVLPQIQQQLNKGGIGDLAKAYIAAVKACRPAVKNATNPHLRNTYADLTAVLDAVKDAFLDQDLWLLQQPGLITIKEGLPYMAEHGILIHSSGQSINLVMELPAFTTDKKTGTTTVNPQTAGSAISYARRYMWLGVAGITQADDDADVVSYNDGAEGPAEVKQTKKDSTTSTPSSAEADADDVLKKVQGAQSLDELKTYRERAQKLAAEFPGKKIFEAYVEKFNKYKAAG